MDFPQCKEHEKNGIATGVMDLRFRVRSYEVDLNGVLSPLTVGNYLQEAAGRHAHALGFGIDDLAREGYLWVLTHLDLQLLHMPPAGSEVVVTTWPTQVVRLHAGRQFQIRTASGEFVGRAATAWMILDARRRRPVRAAEILARIPPQPEDPALPISTERLPVLKKADHEKTLHVRQRDLDVNGHVNNVVYLEWILESIPSNLNANHGLSRLVVNYLAEGLSGDTMFCRCGHLPDGDLSYSHSIIKAADGHELARARSQWRAKDC